jgi:hypothetical protein
MEFNSAFKGLILPNCNSPLVNEFLSFYGTQILITVFM